MPQIVQRESEEPFEDESLKAVKLAQRHKLACGVCVRSPILLWSLVSRILSLAELDGTVTALHPLRIGLLNSGGHLAEQLDVVSVTEIDVISWLHHAPEILSLFLASITIDCENGPLRQR